MPSVRQLNETPVHIDGCEHSFEDLAHTVLPRYMDQLRRWLATPTPLVGFAKPGHGPTTLAKSLGRTMDFSGCYVLLEGDRPFYVGISRKVLSRLRQHVLGRTHFDASLAYAIARRTASANGSRSAAMANAAFQQAFAAAQARLRAMSVAFIEIENPLELYLFEAFAAMTLGTHEWNTFRTH